MVIPETYIQAITSAGAWLLVEGDLHKVRAAMNEHAARCIDVGRLLPCPPIDVTTIYGEPMVLRPDSVIGITTLTHESIKKQEAYQHDLTEIVHGEVDLFGGGG